MDLRFRILCGLFHDFQLGGFMRNYEYELLNSRTKRYFLTQDRKKELNTQDLEL